MHNITVDATKFAFTVLPEFAAWVLDNQLDTYVEDIIRYSTEEQLPLLRKLDKLSAEDLFSVAAQSYTDQLTAIRDRAIHLHIEESVKKWIGNDLIFIDQTEIVADDISLVAFIKRKALSKLISAYTDDETLRQQLLIEIDSYTTHEELVSFSTYIKMQQLELNKANRKLEFQESLLLEAQELSDLGSYFIDFENPEQSSSTPQTHKITEIPQGNEQHFFDNIHHDDRDEVARLWGEALERGGEFNYSFRYKKDGSEKRINSRGIVNVVDGKPINAKGTLRDVTANEMLIKKLTDSEMLHKQAQQLTHLGNWSWTIGEPLISWSDEMYRIYGLEPQSEPITFERFIELVHPDDRERRITEINEAIATGVASNYNLKILTDAGEVKILKGRGSCELDGNRNPVRLVGTCQDITREYHLNRELIALNHSLSLKNTELINTNKELESFNYIASHDLQEPLRKIQLFAGRLKEQTKSFGDPAAEISLTKVIDSAARMQRLISDLIQFSQVSAPADAFETVSLNSLVDEVLETFSDAIDNGSAVFDIGTLHNAYVIPFQFKQLLSNLIGNAIKYKKDNIAAQIKISSEIISAEVATEGNWLKVSICDNGIGFDPEQKDNIFDLFKRLHAQSKYSGTGIGLAICKKIAQKHSGFIKAESELGVGTCFHVHVPNRDLKNNAHAIN